MRMKCLDESNGLRYYLRVSSGMGLCGLLSERLGLPSKLVTWISLSFFKDSSSTTT